VLTRAAERISEDALCVLVDNTLWRGNRWNLYIFSPKDAAANFASLPSKSDALPSKLVLTSTTVPHPRLWVLAEVLDRSSSLICYEKKTDEWKSETVDSQMEDLSNRVMSAVKEKPYVFMYDHSQKLVAKSFNPDKKHWSAPSLCSPGANTPEILTSATAISNKILVVGIQVGIVTQWATKHNGKVALSLFDTDKLAWEDIEVVGDRPDLRAQSVARYIGGDRVLIMDQQAAFVAQLQTAGT